MFNDQQQLIETAKNTGDVAFLSAIGATVMGWLPAVTALVSLVWVAMRMYETYLNILHARTRRREDENQQ